ncbi:NAD(P)H-nitrite reductase [Halobacteroides halobius DSM 5150]|uniref:NAD(P)H-nitrite reductase n=1 Tax=Halobacteroides halobius (strain ATCC 35273 / DSM 5150 / MD-1) TaxID=748449 RepID=L0K7C5_HALHC|nr:FAD-dependent oxidoreductase [Halobacteroides halobius]AGB41187.1 NAD(P)H-nitrite reductase [Halobacteroides halobius DSM 5150]
MRYVVIGASASGINGAKTLRELDQDAEIILISKDEDVYSRCILHHYIAGERNIEELDFSEKDYFKKYDIQWKEGVAVTELDAKEDTLHLSDGQNLSYDKLLIASGASSLIPPIKNLKVANNVVGLRNLADAKKIKETAKEVNNAVVLGAGLVGIDALTGLLEFDLNINLVEMEDRILKQQLDEYTANKYNQLFQGQGVKLKLGVKAKELIMDKENNPQELLLENGERVPCDLVVVATGVRPNIRFLENSGVKTDESGLVIDKRGQTNKEDIYGAGDVTGRNPIWPTAVKEGIIAANNMVGNELELDDFLGSKNTMNFLELPTMSVGLVEAPDHTYNEEIKVEDNNYKKIIHKDGQIYGAVIQGDLSYAGVLTQLIKEEIDVSRIKKPLFEIDYADFFNIKENLEYSY